MLVNRNLRDLSIRQEEWQGEEGFWGFFPENPQERNRSLSQRAVFRLTKNVTDDIIVNEGGTAPRSQLHNGRRLVSFSSLNRAIPKSMMKGGVAKWKVCMLSLCSCPWSSLNESSTAATAGTMAAIATTTITKKINRPSVSQTLGG